MSIEIHHLFERPEHLQEVARLIHEEWWAEKPGHSVATMAERLVLAKSKDSVPLSLVALRGERPIGSVNLVENDNEERQDLAPWLAVLLVVPEERGRGVGAALVKALLQEAAALGVPRLYLGTDMPDYYQKLGADLFASYPDDDYCIMTMQPRT